MKFAAAIGILFFFVQSLQADDGWRAAVKRIDAVTPGLMAKHKTPGVSVAVIHDGQIVWKKGFGVKRAGRKDPVMNETVFEACSMSKPLFGYAVLKLVEAKKLDIDRPLVEYLKTPYLKDQPLHRKITARMVLQHTTGFPNWRKGGSRGGGPLTVEFEPGTKFGYSGEGFLYLQRVVEEITGEALETWMQRMVLKPLKMSHSSYVWQKEYDRLAAAGHTPEGKVKQNRPLFRQANAAYTLYTTPADYARFLGEIMKSDRSAKHSLNAKSIEAMLSPVVKTKEPQVFRGLGWVITKTDRGNFVSHSGSNGTGFRCYSRFDPRKNRGIVIMTNGIAGKSVWAGIKSAWSGAARPDQGSERKPL